MKRSGFDAICSYGNEADVEQSLSAPHGADEDDAAAMRHTARHRGGVDRGGRRRHSTVLVGDIGWVSRETEWNQVRGLDVTW